MPSDHTQSPHAPREVRIGWCEKALLPEFTSKTIDAKIDTGAKISSIHALDINEYEKGRAAWVSFFTYPLQHMDEPEVFCRAPVTDKRVIKSSNGKSENRFVVRTTLKLAGKTLPIDLTLSDRSSMEFRLLLGRDALHSGFLVDPSAAYVLGD